MLTTVLLSTSRAPRQQPAHDILPPARAAQAATAHGARGAVRRLDAGGARSGAQPAGPRAPGTGEPAGAARLPLRQVACVQPASCEVAPDPGTAPRSSALQQAREPCTLPAPGAPAYRSSLDLRAYVFRCAYRDHDPGHLDIALARAMQPDGLPGPDHPDFLRAVDLRQREMAALLGYFEPSDRDWVVEDYQDPRRTPRRSDPHYLKHLVLAHQLALAGERVRKG